MKSRLVGPLVICAFVLGCPPVWGQCALSDADGQSLDAAYGSVTGRSLLERNRSSPSADGLECVTFASIVAVHVPGSRFVMILDRTRAFSRWEMRDGGPMGAWQRALQRYIGDYLQTSPETLREVFGRVPFRPEESRDLAAAVRTGVFATEALPLRESWFYSGRGAATGPKAARLSRLAIEAVCRYVESRWPDHWVTRVEIDPMPEFDAVVPVRVLAAPQGQNASPRRVELKFGVAMNPNMEPYVGKVYPAE